MRIFRRSQYPEVYLFMSARNRPYVLPKIIPSVLYDSRTFLKIPKSRETVYETTLHPWFVVLVSDGVRLGW